MGLDEWAARVVKYATDELESSRVIKGIASADERNEAIVSTLKEYILISREIDMCNKNSFSGFRRGMPIMVKLIYA